MAEYTHDEKSEGYVLIKQLRHEKPSSDELVNLSIINNLNESTYVRILANCFPSRCYAESIL